MAAGTPPCAWCGAPSVLRLVIEPAHYVRRGGEKVCVQQAITAAACRECSGRTQNQPPPVRTPHTTGARKPGADQMTIHEELGARDA